MDGTKSEPSSKHIFIIVCCSLSLALIAQFIILGSLITSDMGQVQSQIATYLGVNWSNGPIISFEIESDSCPVGSSYALSDTIFPAFDAGCICPSTESGPQISNNTIYLNGSNPTPITNQSIIYDEICTIGQINNGCKTFNSSPPKQIYYWGGSLLCTKRGTSNYFEITLTNKDEDCKQGFKSCGIADSIDSQLCVLKDLDCPINYIKIANYSETIETEFPIDKQSFKNSKQLITSDDNYHGKIANQFIVLDHKPCVNEAENILQITSPPYTCQTTINDQTIDNSWVLLDTTTLEKFVDENSLTQEMVQYPFYDSVKNELVGLYYKSYVGLTKDCIYVATTLFSANELPYLLINFGKNISNSQIDYISFTSITLFVLLILGVVLKIILVCMKKSPSIRSNVTVVLGVSSLLQIIVSIVSMVNISNFSSQYSWFRSNCSDPISYGNIEILNENVSTSMRLAIVHLVLSSLLFLFVIAEHLMITCWQEISDKDSCDPDGISNSSIDEDEIVFKKKKPKQLNKENKISNTSINNINDEKVLFNEADDEIDMLINTKKKQ